MLLRDAFIYKGKQSAASTFFTLASYTITLRFILLCSCCVFHTTMFAIFSSTLTA
jgi:hypothetical protein